MEIVVVDSPGVDDETRLALRELWHQAFGDRFDDHDADHAFGGVHVIVRDGDQVIGHASAVPRQLRFGDQPWRTVGYVEAVATQPSRQGQGVGRLAMQRLHGEIADRWGLAMLSTGRATGFYEKLGWQRWLGLSQTRRGDQDEPDGEHGGLMVLATDPALAPDRTTTVTCEDRPGDAW